jgi:hypothetical protein
MTKRRTPEPDQARDYEEHGAVQRRRGDGVEVRPPPEPDQQINLGPLRTGTDVVTVILKAPAGIVLRLFRMEDAQEPMFGGGFKTVQRAVEVPLDPPVVLNGFANPVSGTPKSITYGGYGVTRGVPRDVWEAWLEQNADSDLVRRGLVYALENDTDALWEAKDRADTRSGMEPLQPGQPYAVTERGLEPASDPKKARGPVVEEMNRSEL